MDESPVAVVPKNSLEEVRLTFSEFHGHNLFDVRIFADFDGTNGERRATKKGISLKVEKLPELIEGLHALREEAVRRGLLRVREAA